MAGIGRIDGELGDGGSALDAKFAIILGLAVDRDANLYIVDALLSLIRKVNADGIINTIAGVPSARDFSGDGGPATEAALNFAEALLPLIGVTQITVDIAGNVYFADFWNWRVRKIDTGGTISTVAGNGNSLPVGDGVPATSVAVEMPLGVAIAADGSLLVAETGLARIRRVEQPNSVLTPIGSDVDVHPSVTTPDGTLTSPVQLTFESVLTPGSTIVTMTSAPPGGASTPPSGFQLGESSIYYDVATSTTFEGLIELCFGWEEGQFDDESRVQLFHFENETWTEVTTHLDTSQNRVCGQVSSLSPFGLFEAVPWFRGFFPPVDNAPTRNIVKAGAAVPVKFSMNGYWGMGIIEAGYPASQPILCATGTPSDVITETVNAGSSSLTYDSSSDHYKYVWKTEKSWANSCRRLQMRLQDGSVHTADFGFTK